MAKDDTAPALRRGWTTGACAAAAAKAAATRLCGGSPPASVAIPLPGGTRPSFAVAYDDAGQGWAEAGVVKDAGDDPDVTHGALVISRLESGHDGSGLCFRAGLGVGTVTRPGLPLPPGEPAINPMPRAMIAAALAEVGGLPKDMVVTVSIPGGEQIAERTLNARLGIVGGLSVLGTTGIVVPYSCAAWIDTIHRGIDVARAAGLTHIAGTTGSTSEKAIQAADRLADAALIEMGDFVGGMLKYLRRHPVHQVTVAGGFAKMCKLGQGLLDLHSKRGSVDFEWLATRLAEIGASPDLQERTKAANTAAEVLAIARTVDLDLALLVGQWAQIQAARTLIGSGILLDVAVFDRLGHLLARTDPVVC